MSEINKLGFIEQDAKDDHFDNIKRYVCVIENRGDDEYCTLENVLRDNAHVLELAQKHNVDYVLIDDKYEIDIIAKNQN